MKGKRDTQRCCRLAVFVVFALLAYAPGLDPQKDTKDLQFIQAAIATLTKGTPLSARVAGNNIQKYCLYLSGRQLIGMQYCAGVYVDNARQVYLAHDVISKEWFQAGPLFAD